MEVNKQKPRTYRELAKVINDMTEEQKDMDITMKVGETIIHVEYYQATLSFVTPESYDGVLDIGHPFIEERVSDD